MGFVVGGNSEEMSKWESKCTCKIMCRDFQGF